MAKKRFDITNGSISVKGLKNSIYIHNDPNIVDIYKKHFEKLGTDQFHWYFTEEYEAKNEISNFEFYSQDRMLWEIEVPEKIILKKICDTAWNFLLKRNPMKLLNYWTKYSKYNEALIQTWQKKFYNF